MEAGAHRDRLLTVRFSLRPSNNAERWRPNPTSSCWDVGGTNNKKPARWPAFHAVWWAILGSNQ